MSTFVLIHGGGDSGWAWHLVEAELRARGHEVVAPDLPGDDESLTLVDYADALVAGVSGRPDSVVVGHSFGAFTAPLVAERLQARSLILLAGMIPAPGEAPDDWWTNTGYTFSPDDDPFVSFYHDVPRELAEESMRRERAHPSSAAGAAPWPLDAWPSVPTRFILCRDDGFFPADFFRRLVPERLGIVPEEIAGSHCVMLSRPAELAELLDR